MALLQARLQRPVEQSGPGLPGYFVAYIIGTKDDILTNLMVNKSLKDYTLQFCT